MISIFYTGASSFDVAQASALESLGGFISCSPVSNGNLGNIFGSLTKYDVSKGQDEYRAIAIKNTSGTSFTSFVAWVEYLNDGDQPVSMNTNDCSISIGYQTPITDDCGNLKTELLPNRFSKPFTITFKEAISQTDPLVIPNLENEEYVVIYLKRSILESAKEPPTSDDCLDILNGQSKLIEIEDISLYLSWI